MHSTCLALMLRFGEFKKVGWGRSFEVDKLSEPHHTFSPQKFKVLNFRDGP